MLWKGLNFYESLNINKRKYLIDIVEMNSKRFNLLMEMLKIIRDNHDSLMSEIHIRKTFIELKIN